MNSLDILHYVLSVAIILIALVIIAIGVAVVLFLSEARKAMQMVHQTATEMKRIRESFQTGMVHNIFSLGRSLFQKKTQND